MMKSLRGCFCTILLIAVSNVYSSNVLAQYSFRHLTTRDGLIQGSVYHFLEDNRGYMWMSTQAGLNRFDGREFASYVHDDLNASSISKGEVRGIAQAPNGDIWVGTEVGLSRFVAKTNRFENHYLKTKKGKAIYSQHLAFYADDSTVWYLNDRQGIVRMNYHSGKQTILFADANFSYQFKTQIIHFDPVGQIIWLIQPTGILKLNNRRRNISFYFTGKTNGVLDTKLIVYGIFSKDNKTIWLSTDKGLVELKNEAYTLHPVEINKADDIVFSITMTNGHLWLSTSKRGILVYDPVKKVVIQNITNDPLNENSLAVNLVSTLYTDSKGVVWANAEPRSVDLVFTDSLTISKYDDHVTNPQGFNKASIRGITQNAGGDLWVGTSGAGIRKITKRGIEKPFDVYNGFPQASVRNMLTDSSGNIWISTVAGLVVIPKDESALKTVHFTGPDPAKSNFVRGVLQVGKDHFLILTMGGMFRLRNGVTTLLSGSKEAYTGSVYYDLKRGELFVGRSERDLRCYHFDGEHLTYLYDALPGHSILNMTSETDRAGKAVLWVATDNGLIKFDPEKRKILKSFSTRDGLPDPVVYAVIADNAGGIWMSTNKGLARLDSKEEFQRIRHTEGIEFNSFASLKARDGSIYFGSVAGLFRVMPGALAKASSRALAVTGIFVNDSLYHPFSDFAEINGLALPANQNNITFQLAALDYLSDIPAIYEYRRIELNEKGNWAKYGPSSLINFQNLPAGDYHYEFRALDANGFYTDSKAVYFFIKSPFWRTWWFITLLFLAGAGLLYLLVRLYVNRQQAIQKELTGRIISAQESERFRLAMDIHDDVSNTLAAAKNYLHNYKKNDPQLYQKDIDLSKELIQKATEDLRNITHDLMPVEFEKYSLPDVVEKRVEEWNNEGEIMFTYIFAGTYTQLNVNSELMIYRIVTEIVQNIRKHSKASAAIIQVIYQDQELILSIEDNGIGFGKKQTSRIHSQGIGLKNLNTRAEYLKADLQFSSDQGGVLVHLIVPYAGNRPDSRYFG
ncbi:ligand-binding sensor domain-containing protein [Dyadobacter psychrotolerans]|uniref:histidine kinase n=1 Tax=Dyadobacter psychrotolerans TaxID=2541721 RepID=A0A4R5DPW3_9BACT|nr:two-component regulator propeller domain-containing protein [Dyadobacter psychrotolerans]TDE12823.1 hypothetical protein E0F88_20980 [Dyadobacter psychrotolerans]